MAIRDVAISPRTSPVDPISTRSRPRNAPVTFPRTIISRASTSAEILPCGPTVTRPLVRWMVPCTSPSTYRSSLPRTSPLISKVDVIIPPEGCTTSAVSPATLRTTGCSARGAGVGAGGVVGTSTAGACPKRPGEDGNLGTIVRGGVAGRTPQTWRVSNQIREGSCGSYVAPLYRLQAVTAGAQNDN